MGQIIMLIGIDASRATKPQKTGTEYYSQQIILHFAKIDNENDYILYSPIAPRGQLAQLPKNFRWKIMPFPRLWSQIRLSWELTWHKKPDVLFEPAHTIPIFHVKNTVVTIHDLGFKYFPKLYTPFERRYHNFSMDFSVKHAKKIIAVSQYTKDDIINNYKTQADKIEVIHHGFDPQLYRPAKAGETPQLPDSVRQPYLFFVGRIEHKKNIIGLLEAYRLLRAEAGVNHQLVLAGKPGWGYEKIMKKLNALPQPLQDDIIQLGYTPEKDVATLMRHADIFVFPTFFEGFGLPVLEAMASATPVVCSNITSLPEIVGNAAALVNPAKPLEMAAAASRIIHQKKYHDTLVDRSLKRAREFSWEKAARETLTILSDAGQK